MRQARRFIAVLLLLPWLSVRAQAPACAYSFGLIAKDRFDLNGNGFLTDSFDSSDPTKSTAGLYDPIKKQPNGNVAVGNVFTGSLNVGTATIYGSILTSPTGTVATIAINGGVGPTFVTSDQATTVADAEGRGWIRHDCSLYVPEVVLPSTAWARPLGVTGSGNGNITKSTTLLAGDYIVDAVTLNNSGFGDTLSIAGAVRLYVTGDFSVSGLGQIIIEAGGNLTVYMGGSVFIAGQSILNNAGSADRNIWFALDSSTSLTADGNGRFIGVIYAPNASVNFKAGGSSGDASGVILANKLALTGTTRFHFDEKLHSSSAIPWSRFCRSTPVTEGITTIQLMQTHSLVHFPMNPYQSYRVEYADALPPTNWMTLVTTNTLACTNEFMAVTDPNAGNVSQRFYRLRIGSQP